MQSEDPTKKTKEKEENITNKQTNKQKQENNFTEVKKDKISKDG